MTRRPRLLATTLLVLGLAALGGPAGAVIHAGNVAPDFHKTDLDGLSQTLSQYRGHVVVLFLLGWD
jgi:hypothetical protein